MDCLQTVSELYMYICVSLPVNEPYQTLVSLHQSVLCGYANVTFFFFGGGGCLICLIVLAVKLLTGFEAFAPPPWKDFALGASVVTLDGASIVQIHKGVGLALFSEQFTKDVFKTLHNIHYLCIWSSGYSVRHRLGRQFKSINKGKTWKRHPPAVVHQITVVPKNWQDFLWDDNKLFHYLSNCCFSCT